MRKFIFTIASVIFLSSCTKNDVTAPVPPAAVKQKQVVVTEAPTHIQISKEDRTCQKDADCEVILDACSCSCGEGVNKAHVAKYRQILDEFCKTNPPQRMCKMSCDSKVTCQEQLCTYTR